MRKRAWRIASNRYSDTNFCLSPLLHCFTIRIIGQCTLCLACLTWVQTQEMRWNTTPCRQTPPAVATQRDVSNSIELCWRSPLSRSFADMAPSFAQPSKDGLSSSRMFTRKHRRKT